ncbi:MAG: ATP-binding protein [Candidatus Riflebacteria bacterium]|nr:ATP-binding protein [Candidatus Riflebacteria bacterium]
MFVNRKRELGFLRDRARNKTGEFIVIYGKRRVGKTELVKQFFKGIPHVYFLADKTSEKEQLRNLAEKIGLFNNDSFLLSRSFGTWQEVFTYLKTHGSMALAIDEFPYLIESNSAVPSIFQRGWDEYLKDSEVFLILSGSSIGMMETEVLGHKSPLFGRRTGQLRVEPMDFFEAKDFFKDLTDEQFMPVYCILGGTPAYLLQFNSQKSLWKNIEDQILKTEAYLYREPEFILREELREPRNYFSILRAMAMGKTRVSEIINETGFDKSLVGKYISILQDLSIVERDVPVTEKNPEKSKKGLYFLSDEFFRFWFRFVFPNMSFIEEDDSSYVLRQKIQPEFDQFISLTFEKVCRKLVSKGNTANLRFPKTGRWWTRDAEIDVVGVNEEENTILFGEAKWSNKKVGIDVYNNLRQKATLVEWGMPDRKEIFVLFSRKGFTADLVHHAKNEKIILHSFS